VETLDNKMNNLLRNKKGQFELASNVVWGVVAFALAIIVGLIVIGLLTDGGFFTAGSAEENLTLNLSSNLTTGLNTVVAKFPTIFTVIAMAIVLAIIGLLIVIVRKFGFGGGGGNFAQ